MMSPSFFACLEQERSIFRNFSSYSEIGDFEAFCSPGLTQIPHWNLVYPSTFGNDLPKPEVLQDLIRYFEEKKTPGHLLITEPKLASKFAEESEYFELSDQPVLDADSVVHQMNHIESELEQFCDLIQISFSLSDDMAAYFKKKMALLQNRPGTIFYIIRLKEKIVGGCSVFITDNGSSFMFNVATHPRMQGQGVAKEIIAYAARKSSRPLYTYSHNPAMRESLLPKLGFRSLGTLWCVPLEEIK